MHKISGKQVKEITKLYSENNSILETAKATGISTVKVRKILITEGLWESATSIKIGQLLEQGLTTEEIAQKLYMSAKNVQAYMPYERGLYNGEEITREAIRASKYRSRMKKAAEMQVIKRKPEEDYWEGGKKMTDNKVIEFEDKSSNDMTYVLKLHLELDMKHVNEEEKEILKKYGSMKNSISRDILVPSDITLHALNYAILRMFGWQNAHLHNFSLPDDVFKELTENQFSTWAKMAGVYFRSAIEDYDDVYWDDDYKEGESIRSWMRKKYTGPYKYGGFSEHYLENQIRVKSRFSEWDEIIVRRSAEEAKKRQEPYKVKLMEATLEQAKYMFAEMICDELIERLTLIDVLRIPNMQKYDAEKIRDFIDKKASKFDINKAYEQYQNTNFRSWKQVKEYFEQYDFRPLPITDSLRYLYDYRDKWEVLIRCETAYKADEQGVWTDTEGKARDDLAENLEEVVKEHRPICIAKDGVELVDDVGGIAAFCQMLNRIYDCDFNDKEAVEERENILAWANMMGWTGRKISPKGTL